MRHPFAIDGKGNLLNLHLKPFSSQNFVYRLLAGFNTLFCTIQPDSFIRKYQCRKLWRAQCTHTRASDFNDLYEIIYGRMFRC